MSSPSPAPPLKLTVGGIATQVYGVSSLPSSTPNGLAVLFLLHGRFGSAAEASTVSWANSFLDHTRAEREKAGEGKELLVVTFDQRNHGERTVDAIKNKGWKDRAGVGEGLDNVGHAVDMLAIQSECTG